MTVSEWHFVQALTSQSIKALSGINTVCVFEGGAHIQKTGIKYRRLDSSSSLEAVSGYFDLFLSILWSQI